MSKTIFFITNELSGGGAERVMSNLANYLIKRDYNIKFILLNGNEIVYPLDKAIEIIIRPDVQARDTLAQIQFIRKYMKKNKNALFVSFFTHQNLYTILASVATKAKVLVSERNDPANTFTRKLQKIGDFSRKILYKNKHCKKIVFQTQGASDYFEERIAKKGVVIANPLKNGLPHPYTGQRKKTVVAVGRISPQKNYRLLFDAFAKFSEIHPDYKLEIYGNGASKDAVKKYIAKLNLTDKVELCGFCKNVHERILDAGMYVMSSDFEGLSNAMLEALAIGLPVISTDHPPGGARAYITSYENGILTPVRDVDAMTKAMCYMTENTEKAQEMGQKAALVREALSEDTICKKWQTVFDDILK